MRIAIDLQGIQSEGSRTRGIGRYSIEIVTNIIKYYPNHEIILVANAALSDLRTKFQAQLNKNNIFYLEWYSPCPLAYTSKNIVNIKIASYLRSYFFQSLHADIILFTSLLEGFSDNCLTDFNRDFLDTPVISLFYDLIPLLNPKLYLNSNPEFNQYYHAKLADFKKLDGLLAISNSSAEEVKKYLEFDSKYVFNVSSACDRNIFNTTKEASFDLPLDLEKISPFLLYTGASDPRKNVKGLLQAYSQLPEELKRYKLLLVGKLLKPEIELIDNWINQFQIDSDNVIKTGYVTDKDLVLLYRKCSLFIYPSLHEGFGLPVLEAMSCGTAVIGSNRTSVPEVIGNQKALFDPENIDEMKNLIQKALLDKQFYNELLTNSHVQRSKFSWKITVDAINSACEKVISDKKNLRVIYNWKDISTINNNNLNNLLLALRNDLLIKSKLDDKLISYISASLDKMSFQIDSLIRSLYSDNKITSWRVEGPLDSSYSLSILNRYFAEAINAKGYQLSLHNTEGYGDYLPNLKYLKSYKLIYSKLLESNKSNNINISNAIISRNLYPPRVKDMKGFFNLLHTYGWEESGFPSEWVDELNTYLQGITVMSGFVKKVLIDNGVYIPIKVSGLGLDHIDKINIKNEYIIESKKYKILHLSSCFPRKGIDVLLKAYGDKFTINDDVSLIIKTFKNPHNNVQDLLNNLKDKNPFYPDVVIINDDLSDSDLKSLLMQSNLLVAPSRGEGFGLPIGEAMKLGIPVITTGAGGQEDFCNSENCWLIDYRYVPSDSHFGIYNSYWFEPSSLHLSELIYDVFSSSKAQIKKRTDIAKQTINKFRWHDVAQSNIDFVEEQLAIFNSNKNFNLGCISTWETKCGIASYSKHLFENCSEDLAIFSPFTEQGVDDFLYPSWHLNSNSEDFSYLLNKVKILNITSLVIQFNYGFFDFNQLSNLIKRLLNQKINIIIILHSTVDPLDDKSKTLSNLTSSFKKCHRLLVHTIDDLNRLKDIGLTKNVTLFPHGILDFKCKRKTFFNSINNFSILQKKTLASYGFCLPNKGYKELILAVDILKSRGIHVYLNIYSALYSQDYLWVYKELNNLVDKLDLGRFIKIHTQYMSDEDSLERLSTHKCIVFPYQSSNESSSASVRHGIASTQPVLVTPLSIFKDVSNLVDYLPGCSPVELANGIQEFFDNDKNNTSAQSKPQTNNIKSKILENIRFSKLSPKLISMIKSLEINDHHN